MENETLRIVSLPLIFCAEDTLDVRRNENSSTPGQIWLGGHKAQTFNHMIRLRVRIKRILQPDSRITHAAYGQCSKSPAHRPYFCCRDAR